MTITAVVVTRGDHSMWPIIDSYPPNIVDDVVVWDNSRREADLGVYGRYAAIADTPSDVILVQDDDVILPRATIEALLDAYEPGVLVANMPERFRPHYPDSCLVGFGAIFDRDLPEQAFKRFYGEWERPQLLNGWQDSFSRTCDVVFTALTSRKLVDFPVQILDYAYGDDRMYKSKDHVWERAQMLQLSRQVRDA